jgi:hypothetical protein
MLWISAVGVSILRGHGTDLQGPEEVDLVSAHGVHPG